MFKASKTVIVACAIAAAAAVPAEAKRKPRLPVCQPPMEADATGTGILGLGSAKARLSARQNFEAMAANKYGPQYAHFSRARGVKWDCKKGAILLAKCVVVARPCRY